ncbi:MAG: M20/M25/M40 family metallo-hydrolase [Coriobacteriales bacterium]|jgi:tripeptide aminopeptidase|nr:M20/M25/M40 family metallo-hydrolase [Coriobacteriales bacterium]
MNSQRLVNTFLELVQLDSPSRHEGAVAAYCRQALEAAGCTVRFDDSAAATGSDTGNLIAELPARLASGESGAGTGVGAGADAGAGAGASAGTGTGTAPASGIPAVPKVYFSAHMDTVSPGEGIKPLVEDGIIRPSGPTILGGDDKGGVAPIIELIRTLAESDEPHPAIGVLLSTCEEISLRGAKAMDYSGFAGEPCFVLDADGQPGGAIIGAPFHDAFTATFHGIAAHAGVRPEAGVSAINLAAAAIASMELGRLDAETTANIGTIQGGAANNIVADTCVVTGECRSLGAERLQEVHAAMDAALHAAAASVEGASVDVQWVVEYPGFMLTEDDPLVQLVLEEAAGLGLPAKATVTGGGSDANILADAGLKPVVLATGMDGIHSLGEQLRVKDLEDITNLIIAIVRRLSQGNAD